MASFRDHVASKHEDRDKGFESEYQVWNHQIHRHNSRSVLARHYSMLLKFACIVRFEVSTLTTYVFIVSSFSRLALTL